MLTTRETASMVIEDDGLYPYQRAAVYGEVTESHILAGALSPNFHNYSLDIKRRQDVRRP
jgi:hypothetical protein